MAAVGARRGVSDEGVKQTLLLLQLLSGVMWSWPLVCPGRGGAANHRGGTGTGIRHTRATQ